MCIRHRAVYRRLLKISRSFDFSPAGTKDEVLQNEGAVRRESNPRAALYSCESMWIYLIQVKKKVLESGSQLSDASIKMSTRILLNGFSKESRGSGQSSFRCALNHDGSSVFFFVRLTSRSDSWLALTTMFIRLRYLTWCLLDALQASRISFLIYILCKVKYMNYV